jgi:hypothetical protein
VIGPCCLLLIPVRIAAEVETQSNPSGGNNESTICVCACGDHAVGLYQQQQSESPGENYRYCAAELDHDSDLPGRIATALLGVG